MTPRPGPPNPELPAVTLLAWAVACGLVFVVSVGLLYAIAP